MSDSRYFKIHRTWEDWCGMLLGVLIMLLPWFPKLAGHEAVDTDRSFLILNTFTVGLLVFGLAQLEYVALQRWEQAAEIALGLWLIASPYILGYSGDGVLNFWHFKSRRPGGAACDPGVVAGLGAKRPGDA